MTVIVVVLSVAVVASMALCAFFVLGGGLSDEERTLALERLDALAPLTVGGETVAPVETKAVVTGGDGNTHELEGAAGAAAELAFSGLANEMAFASEPTAASVSVTWEGAAVWSGTAAEFSSFVPPEDARYEVEVRASFDEEGLTAEAVYRFGAAYSAEPRFWLSSATVRQSDAILLRGENLREGEVTVTVPYPYEPQVHREGAEISCILPFNFMREAGEYAVTVSFAGRDYELPYTVTETDYEVQHLVVSASTVSSTVGSNTAGEEIAAKLYSLYAPYTDEIYWSDLFIQPCEGSITTEYGIKRYTNDATTPSRHAGIDIACAEGTPVAASNTGTVLFAGDLQMTGYTVLIEHGQGVHTVYFHMSGLNCAAGDTVTRGDTIGYVGSTGFATGPHLHFEMMVGSVALSPWYAFDGTAGFYAPAE